MAAFTIMTELEQLVCTHTHKMHITHRHSRIMHQTDLENWKATIILCCLYKELTGMKQPPALDISKAHYDHKALLVLSLHPDIIHTPSYASTVDMTAGVIFCISHARYVLKQFKLVIKKHEFWQFVYKSLWYHEVWIFE